MCMFRMLACGVAGASRGKRAWAAAERTRCRAWRRRRVQGMHGMGGRRRMGGRWLWEGGWKALRASFC